MSTASLKDRVTALEVEVEQLKRRLDAQNVKGTGSNWRAIVGTFANDPLYDEAMRLGRAYRESLRSKPKKTKSPKRRRD